MSAGFMLGRKPLSICVLRLSAIGDVCHMLAVVQNLQRAFPDTPITWIIGKVEASLIAHVKGIEFIIFDKSQGISSYWRLYQQLKHRQFDVLLHAQVALRASIASLCVRAKIRLGFDRLRAKDGQWLFTRQHIAAVPKQHVIEGFLEFARALGVDDLTLRWQVPLDEADEAFAKLHCSDHPILVINAAASDFERNWSVEGYAAVADYVIERYGYRVILLGGPRPAEIALSQSIEQQMKHPVLNLVGQMTLRQSLAVIAKAKIMIAPDTGPVHMATMVGTPVIGLYACSNPLRTGPYKSMATTVNAYPQALAAILKMSLDDAPWGQRVRGQEVMQLIDVETVKQQIDHVIVFHSSRVS